MPCSPQCSSQDGYPIQHIDRQPILFSRIVPIADALEL